MTNVLLNNEKNGVEIYFDSKPAQEILKSLKNLGFRWSKFKNCWYAKQSENTIKEAEKIANSKIESVAEVTTVTKKAIKSISLWDATTWVEIEVNKKLSCKEIAQETRKHFKTRFPFCKFSITSDRKQIRCEIKSSPFAEDSDYLKAIQSYCDKYIENYNYCTCYDPYGDYGSSYSFYFFGTKVDYDYIQTEATEEIQKAGKEYDTKQAEQIKIEKEREEAEYQKYLLEQEESNKRYQLRIAEEKKQIEYINNNVDVVEVEEKNQYFVIGSEFANLNKNSTLDRYKKEVENNDYTLENVKITREVHFKDVQSLEYFSGLLLNDFDFLEGTGGSYTDDNRIKAMTDYDNMTREEMDSVKWNLYGVAIYLDNELQFVVDAQGYSYARYVGLIDNATIEKNFTYSQLISDAEIEELESKANTIIDLSLSVIDSNDLYKTWNNTNWEEYKEKIKVEFKRIGLKPTKGIIQQLPEDLDSLKVAMYKILVEVDGIQDQFANAGLEAGEQITMFYISDFGGMVDSKVTFKEVVNEKYAQYDNAVKLTFRPHNKKSDYYSYFYSTLLVYKGWHDLPKTVLNEISESKSFNITKSKYHSCDDMQFDEILEYFNRQGIKPVVNTYKPDFNY